MDHFGIGAAMRAAAEIYFQAARRTGRTRALVDNTRDGDRVVFVDRREAERVRRLCQAQGKDVECIVLPADQLHLMHERGRAKRRLVFDHSWVEARYRLSLDETQAEIDAFQKRFSSDAEQEPEARIHAHDELRLWR